MSHYPPSRGSFVPKLRPRFLWTPELLLLQWIRSSSGRVVKLLACGARGPEFDSLRRHLNFQRLVISCFQVAIRLKYCGSDVNPQYNQPTTDPIHYTSGQPRSLHCMETLHTSQLPDHPHRMTRRPVTRMPRVTTLPNVTCQWLGQSPIQALMALDVS